MGLGVPVVGTSVDGFPDTLAKGRGLIIGPDDPAALAAALDDVLNYRRTTDLRGARVWAQQFNTDRIAAQYEDDYRSLRATAEGTGSGLATARLEGHAAASDDARGCPPSGQ